LVKAELFDLGAGVLDQLAGELLLRVLEFRVDGPVFARHEGGNFVLAFADHAQRGLCTRPADSPGRTFFHSRGDKLKPTRKSKARRACWAFTKSTDSSRGLAIASLDRNSW
jgi:hypothetical protein